MVQLGEQVFSRSLVRPNTPPSPIWSNPVAMVPPMTSSNHLRAVPDELTFEPEDPPRPSWVNNDSLPEDFFLATDLKSQDKHGHGTAVYTKIPEEVIGHVAKVVEDQRTPYRTTGDFYRHAVLHLLRDIEANKVTGDSYTRQVKVLLTKARAETRRIETVADEQMVDSAATSIEVAMGTHNLRALKDAISDAQQIMDIAESDVSSLQRLVDSALRELER